jgi:carboxylesterase
MGGDGYLSELKVLEGCEEFAIGEGPVGALLVHGFTGSPQGMRDLGVYLSERGIAVVGPRLPGHGTTWQDLGTHSSDDWIGSVEASFNHLASQTEQVFLVGLSFGAALCLDLAMRHPDGVAGIVTLAAFLGTKDPKRHLAPVIARVIASIPGVGNDIADPEGKEIAYDRLPTKAAYSMMRYVKRARAGADSIGVPLLAMHGRGDKTSPPANSQYLYDTVASTDKELLYLERSQHVITLDYEKSTVFERTYQFIKERAAHAL